MINFHHWLWLIPAFCIGACIGSFLNVVIYRVPRGLSINQPKRSFCPECKKQIPAWLNLPLISWIWLGGKCKQCGTKIPSRYIFVELFTAVLFTVTWWLFPPMVCLCLWGFVSLLVAITYIDAEHLIIPTSFTWAGSALGLVACALWPKLPIMWGVAGNWLSGLKWSGIGWAVGFFGLWGIVELGKMAFGKKAIQFEKPETWSLREATNDQDPMLFVIGEDEFSWWDLFNRKTDQLWIETQDIRVDGKSVGKGKLIIQEREIILPDGTVNKLEDLRSLDGSATSVIIPREAMGMGDIHLLGMIGAFFGWAGVFFSLFAATIIALFSAIIGKIGFGKQLPFGPFLAAGALVWLYGGWKFWAWYMNFLEPIWGR